MFEQDRYLESQRSRGMFRDTGQTGPGMSRYQVSGTGDSAELAADQAADQAVGGLFRSPEGTDVGGFQADLADADLSGGGSPLPEGLMGSMEQSLGASFSGVRLHTDAGADRASRQISARAFTRGQDIYFRGGEYSPDTREGQHLIAHELAHVAAGDTGIHRAGDSGNTGNNTAGSAPAQRTLSPDEEKFNNAIARLEAANGPLEGAQTLVTSFETDAGKWGSLQAAAQQVKDAGSAAAANARVTGIEALIARAGAATDASKDTSLLSQLNKIIADAESAAGNLGYDDNHSGMALLKSAKQVRDKLNELPAKVEAIKPSVAFAREEAGAMAPGGTGKEFSEPVENMLNNSACDAFFKAVEKVRGTANMASEIQTAKTDAAVKSHLSQNVGNSTAEKMSRGLGISGTALGYSSAVVSAIDQGASYDEEIKGEDNVSGASERTATAATHMGAINDTLGAVNDTLSAGADTAILHSQEAKRKQHIEEMKNAFGAESAEKLQAADHKGRTAVAASWIKAGGSTVGAANSIYGTTTGKGDEDTTKIEEKKGTAMSLTADSAAVAGDIMGLSVNSAKAAEQRKQDQMAKKGMLSIAQQLLKLVSNPAAGSVDQQISDLCNFIIGAVSGKKKLNTKGNTLKARISGILSALNGNPNANTPPSQPAAPAVEKSAEKKKFLTMLLAMETSRAASKSGASDARKDVAFDVLSTIGSLTSLASSITSMAGAGMAGLILNTVASAIGLIGTIRDTADLPGSLGKAGQDDRNEERDNKVNACTAAVEQMAALPDLKLEEVRAAKQNKLPLSGAKMESAEQYAAVFSIVQSANVNMVDFLYAVSKGDFGGQSGTAQDSVKAMLMNLEFTN